MLTVIEGRVLGSLLEKERTVPDQYPLTLNTLLLACNQATSREPVMRLEEHELGATLAGLKTQGLLRYVHPSHGRSVTRYRQVVDEAWGLDAAAASIIAVLLLRGPQTVAELRTRTERLHPFESAEAVEAALRELATAGFAQLLERQPGQKELRWQQLLAEEAVTSAASNAGGGGHDRSSSGGTGSSALAERLAQLEARIARLEEALADLLPEATSDATPTEVQASNDAELELSGPPSPIPAELAVESFGPER